MLYNSTRSNNYECTSAEAIKTGLAPDGGLFVPDCFPQFTIHDIDKMKDYTYNQRANDIIGKYLTDYTPEALVFLKKNVDWETFKLFLSCMFYTYNFKEGPYLHPEVLLF